MSILQRACDERDALVERVSELEAAISAAVNRLEEGYPTEAIAILRAPTFQRKGGTATI